MNTFNVIVGISTILGLFVAIYAAFHVPTTKRKDTNVSQKVENSTINNSTVIQSGRDTKTGRD